MLIVYCILIALIKPNLVFSNGIMVIILYALCVVVSIAMVLLIGLSMFKVKWAKALGKWVYKILAKLNIVKKEELDSKIEHFLMQVDDYRNGAVYIKAHPKIVMKGLLYGFLQRTAFFGISCAVYMSFGMPSHLLLDVILSEALIYMTVSSLPLPGGIGVTEKMFLIVYSTIYAQAMITPAVLLTRAINYIFAIIFMRNCFIRETNINYEAQQGVSLKTDDIILL